MPKKRVYIIHGWEGRPDSNWFPWLMAELEKKGFEVVSPQMPNADLPKREEWLAFMRELIASPDENVFLVGHSLGVIAILRYLEVLETDKKIGGALLVAGFSRSIGFKEIDNFTDTPVDYAKVKKSANKIVVINSDNDPYVPIAEGELMKEKLDAKLIILNGAGHMNQGDGFFRLPAALDELSLR